MRSMTRLRFARLSLIASLLGAAPAAYAQEFIAVPDDCDWTMWWPANGATEVSSIRTTFFFVTNDPRCYPTNAVLRATDGAEPPVAIGTPRYSSRGLFNRVGPASEFPLRLGETYTLEFSWMWFDDESNLVPARPYTFTTSTVPDEPPDTDNLTIERFELLPDEGRVVFEGSWPDASPLYTLDFAVPGREGAENPGYDAVDPELPFGFLIPALAGPDLLLEFTGVRFPRGESCATVSARHFSFPAGASVGERACVERGCSAVAAAPSIPWVAGALLLLVSGRRRTERRRGEEGPCA